MKHCAMLTVVLVCVLCVFVVASPTDRQKREFYNPCTVQALAANQTYFAMPGDRTSFIECDLLGHANVMPCPPGLVWDQTRHACNYDFTIHTGSTVKTTDMPHGAMTALCSPENSRTNKLYLPHQDPHKFIQRDLWGNCFELSCPANLVWNAQLDTCDYAFMVGK